MSATTWRIATALLLGLGCRQLQEIPAGVCGNGVLEGAEDCDTFSRHGYSCRPPGAHAECRLDCTRRLDGSAVECPAGFGCDEGGACRRASGSYRALPESLAGNVTTLEAGDFDGDGRDDVLGMEPPGSFGFTKVRLHFFGDDAAPAATWSSSRALADPRVVRISADARSDLVFSDFRVNVWLGQSDRSLIPEVYATYRLPYEQTRILSVLEGEIQGVSALVIQAEQGGQVGFFVPGPDESLRPVASFPERPGDSIAEAATGDLFDDDTEYPCLDIALAHRIVEEVRVYSVCERRSENDGPSWRDRALVKAVELEPSGRLDGPLLIADVNGDHHSDLLIGVEGTLYLAEGDGERLSTARPYHLSVDGMAVEALGMPLAAGDFSGDGAADFVFPPALVISRRGVPGQHTAAHVRLSTPWTSARIADFNGNGLMDVVAASDNAGIDYFNGTGTDNLNAFTIPTTRPAAHLTVADVDGDLLRDLTFVQRGTSGGYDEVSVAFGNPFGVPSAPVTAARTREVRQITAFVDLVQDATSDLIVNYRADPAGATPGAEVALLQGDGSRSLPCPIELSTFANDDRLISVPSVAVVAGSFLHAGEVDAVPLALACDPPRSECAPGEQRPELWLLSNLGGRQGFPTRLGWDFEPRMAAVRVRDGSLELAVKLAAGDLDGDGLDELVVAAADREDASRCILASGALDRSSGLRLRQLQSVVLDWPCSPDEPLFAVDVDGDGSRDLSLLGGPLGGTRGVLVLWNDGDGNFDAGSASVLTAPDAAPRAFTVFRPELGVRPHVAYVTERGVRLLRPVKGLRQFGEEPLSIELERGTGIVAADVEGDGVPDLVVADGGAIRVLRAELLP